MLHIVVVAPNPLGNSQPSSPDSERLLAASCLPLSLPHRAFNFRVYIEEEKANKANL